MIRRVLRVHRRRAGSAPTFEEHVVEAGEGWTLLDALESLRRRAAPDLAYRHSCHHGSCGTCGVRVDGVERLACLTSLAELPGEPVTVEPLRGLPVVADLAVDPSPLLAGLDASWSSTRQAEGRPEGEERFEDCIECGCCLSACPVSAAAPAFLGPAALAAIARELDKRPGREAELLALAGSDRGEALCERHVECSRRCPTGVSPARHIATLRRRLGRG